MFTLLKKTVKFTLVTGLVVGGTAAAAVAVLGDGRARAVTSQIQAHVMEQIDRAIEDPHALRAQIIELQKEYPSRINQVRGDLAELDEEIRQLQRDQAISLRVVELANADLEELDSQLASFGAGSAGSAGSASNAAYSSVGSHGAESNGTGNHGRARLSAAVTSSVGVLSYDRAVARRNQIAGTRGAYANRAADADYSLTYLAQQRQRLADLLMKLETEQAEFRTQVSSLNRQIEAIERNDRLIEQLERFSETFSECSAYEATSLDNVTNRLASIRSRQEAELDVLAKSEERATYEDLARMQIAQEDLDPGDSHGGFDDGHLLFEVERDVQELQSQER